MIEKTLELDKVYGLTEAETASLLSIGEPVHIAKGSRIISIGDFNDNIFIISDGLLRSFDLTDGDEITSCFNCRGEIFVDLWCYKLGERSKSGLEALVDVNAVIIPKSRIEDWSQESVENSNMVRKLFEGIAALTERRLYEYFQCDSAEKRYTMMMKQYPEIFQQVSMRKLASYLWITPRSLSRIRRNIK